MYVNREALTGKVTSEDVGKALRTPGESFLHRGLASAKVPRLEQL